MKQEASGSSRRAGRRRECQRRLLGRCRYLSWSLALWRSVMVRHRTSMATWRLLRELGRGCPLSDSSTIGHGRGKNTADIRAGDRRDGPVPTQGLSIRLCWSRPTAICTDLATRLRESAFAVVRGSGRAKAPEEFLKAGLQAGLVIRVMRWQPRSAASLLRSGRADHPARSSSPKASILSIWMPRFIVSANAMVEMLHGSCLS